MGKDTTAPSVREGLTDDECATMLRAAGWSDGWSRGRDDSTPGLVRDAMEVAYEAGRAAERQRIAAARADEALYPKLSDPPPGYKWRG